MQKDSHFFEDLAKLTSGAAGAMLDMKREFEAMIADKLAGFMAQHQFVSRDEFEVVRDMAQKAREENEALKKELEALKKR
jgi:BMFP domain-containing protein YqiC